MAAADPGPAAALPPRRYADLAAFWPVLSPPAAYAEEARTLLPWLLEGRVDAWVADGVVRFGSTVTLKWSDGRAQPVRLVGPDEADDAVHEER